MSRSGCFCTCDQYTDDIYEMCTCTCAMCVGLAIQHLLTIYGFCEQSTCDLYVVALQIYNCVFGSCTGAATEQVSAKVYLHENCRRRCDICGQKMCRQR